MWMDMEIFQGWKHDCGRGDTAESLMKSLQSIASEHEQHK